MSISKIVLAGITLAGVGLSASSSRAAVVTFQTGQAPNFATADSLQGVSGTIESGGAFTFGTEEAEEVDDSGFGILTDATTAATPTIGLYGKNASITYQFDLGAAGAASRQLDSLSLWTHNNNGFFNGLTATFQVSLDGVSFLDVASTAGNIGNSAAGTYNNLTVAFAPGEVVGFRYLRLLDEPGNDEAGGERSAILFELDGNVSTVAVPEPGALVAGCSLAGLLLRARRRKA